MRQAIKAYVSQYCKVLLPECEMGAELLETGATYKAQRTHPASGNIKFSDSRHAYAMMQYNTVYVPYVPAQRKHCSRLAHSGGRYMRRRR